MCEYFGFELILSLALLYVASNKKQWFFQPLNSTAEMGISPMLLVKFETNDGLMPEVYTSAQV